MILYGTNIQSPADELRKVPEDYLFNSLKNPKPAIQNTIRQLRIVYAMDTKRYAQLKRQLPYFVCAQFTPPYRRKENFAYIESFVLDFDHLADKQLSLTEIRNRITKDERVMMCFASPSEDGLKVMFKLKERCYDAGLYSLFYKEFAKSFAIQYSLTQVVDGKTSDVSRACFVSIDPKAYYNPFCEPVDLKQYINVEDPSTVFEIKYEQEQHEKVQKKKAEDILPKMKDPDKDILLQIRQKLNPNTNTQTDTRSIYIPEKLNEIIDNLVNFINSTGLQTTEVINIQYAKKIRAKLGIKEAEVNLFFGKRGFSVVISPRLGTDEELNNLLADIIKEFLNKTE